MTLTGSNLSIFRKGLLLVGVPIAFQLVMLGALFHLQADSNDAEKWAIHTKDVMAQAEESYRLLADYVAQMRGAVITADPNFAPGLDRMEDQVNPALQRLEDLMSDNPAQLDRVRAFRATSTELLAWINEEHALVAEGRIQEATQRVASLHGEALVRTLRGQLQTILAEEQRLDRERLERVVHTRRMSYWFIGIAAAVTLVLAGAALWVFTRGIASRLASLADHATRLADRRAISGRIEGTDEIGRVDLAFRAAADRLAEADVAEQRHRDELERRAADLATANSDLGRANDDLRYKTQEIETFVYSVSHDLRSPLVNLQGFGKELARSCEELRSAATQPEVPAETRRRITQLIDGDVLEAVHFIQTAVSRSANIIDALLRLSRAGRVEYKRQRVNVRAIVDCVVDAMQASVRERGAEVVVDDLPEAEADPTAVEQIFGNLLANAVNYLDRSRPGHIDIGALPPTNGEQNVVHYFVRDNGMGIPQAYQSKIFVAFQRLHGHVAPGEGIGLALVRRVIERIGGSISVDSTEGAGSTFHVTLPAASEPVAAESQPNADSVQQGALK